MSITLEQFSPQRVDEHVAVGKTVYSSPEVLNPDHLLWKHLNGPWGPSLSVSLRNQNNDLVGRSFIQPRTFITPDGQQRPGGLITDLVVTPAARNASALITMTRAIRAPSGFSVIAHTSNETSDVIYRGLFKFPTAFSLIATGVPIRVSRALKARNSGTNLTRTLAEGLVAPWRWLLSSGACIARKGSGIAFGPRPTSEEISSIFNDFSGHAGQHFSRNEQFLHWRFETGPIFRADLKWVWHNGQCIGYIALKKVTIQGLDILVIIDSVFRHQLSERHGLALRLMCAQIAVDSDCDAVFSLANLNNSALRWLGRGPYLRIPDRFLPHATPIFIHTSETTGMPHPLPEVFFTLADLDYF